MEQCAICKQSFEYGEMYEYRGVLACEKDFNEAIKQRDTERSEIIAEEQHKTERFRGLDLSNSIVGKANKQILKRDREIARKESLRIKNYERLNSSKE